MSKKTFEDCCREVAKDWGFFNHVTPDKAHLFLPGWAKQAAELLAQARVEDVVNVIRKRVADINAETNQDVKEMMILVLDCGLLPEPPKTEQP